MKTSEDLFILIKSLSKSEKGYFKKFAALNSRDENASVILFDAIEAQEVYDEKKAISALNRTAPLRNFSVLKAYLYTFILKSLRLYHSQRSAGLYVKEQIEYIEILYEKGLFSQCEKIIDKTMNVAKKYEFFPLVQELFKWKIVIMGTNSFLGFTNKEVKQLFNEANEYADKYKNENLYRYYLSLVASKRKEKNFVREDEDKKIGIAIHKNSLLKNEKMAKSFSALRFYYQFYSLYHYDNGNTSTALTYADKLASLMEAQPHQLKENPRIYVITLYNALMSQLTLKNYKDPYQVVKKMKAIEPNWGTTQTWIHYNALDAEMNLCIVNGQFEKGLTLIAEAEKLLQQYDIKGRFKQLEIEFYKMFFIIYFGNGKFSKANAELNKIINYPLINFRVDMHVFARIMSLIVHYELGNTDLLAYTVKSTYRFLYKRNKLYKFESMVLNFVRTKLSKIKTHKEQLAAFKELKIEAEKLINDPYESRAFMNFDFVAWLRSKIENRPFADIVREQAS